MRKGAFYSVGVGPGDPELLTFKAVRIIKDSDVIAVPISGGSKNSALEIAEGYIENSIILECPMPMIKDKGKLQLSHENAAAQIAAYLEDGKAVAFLTIGDPSIYSTAMYVHRILKNRGYETHMIPGVTSFCAAAASLDTSLCEGSEVLNIIPASYPIRKALSAEGNKVLMKSGKSLVGIKDNLAAQKNCSIKVVENASMKNEKIYRSLNEINENSGYFSTVVLKEKGEGK